MRECVCVCMCVCACARAVVFVRGRRRACSQPSHQGTDAIEVIQLQRNGVVRGVLQTFARVSSGPAHLHTPHGVCPINTTCRAHFRAIILIRLRTWGDIRLNGQTHRCRGMEYVQMPWGWSVQRRPEPVRNTYASRFGRLRKRCGPSVRPARTTWAGGARP